MEEQERSDGGEVEAVSPARIGDVPVRVLGAQVDGHSACGDAAGLVYNAGLVYKLGQPDPFSQSG